MKLLLISVLSLTGCAATLPRETSEAHATATFQDHETMPYFESVDGHVLRDVPTTLALKPGEHTLRYSCAAHLDGPPDPKITMGFRAGKTYVFRCSADHELTAVEER